MLPQWHPPQNGSQVSHFICNLKLHSTKIYMRTLPSQKLLLKYQIYNKSDPNISHTGMGKATKPCHYDVWMRVCSAMLRHRMFENFNFQLVEAHSKAYITHTTCMLAARYWAYYALRGMRLIISLPLNTA